jgi:hypothetical protein
MVVGEPLDQRRCQWAEPRLRCRPDRGFAHIRVRISQQPEHIRLRSGSVPLTQRANRSGSDLRPGVIQLCAQQAERPPIADASEETNCRDPKLGHRMICRGGSHGERAGSAEPLERDERLGPETRFLVAGRDFKQLRCNIGPPRLAG